jgi:hypothetical protein
MGISGLEPPNGFHLFILSLYFLFPIIYYFSSFTKNDLLKTFQKGNMTQVTQLCSREQDTTTTTNITPTNITHPSYIFLKNMQIQQTSDFSSEVTSMDLLQV